MESLGLKGLPGLWETVRVFSDTNKKENEPKQFKTKAIQDWILRPRLKTIMDTIMVTTACPSWKK